MRSNNINTIDLYPVYVILFSNDTEFGKLIRKATGSEYSHSAISLDATMNSIYSFSGIPYHRGSIDSGFVRESIWSPLYTKNRHFNVMVIFVSKKNLETIQSKIDYFYKNYMEFKYNDIGLIQYYLNFKEKKNIDESKKKRWFCSEFVAFMMKSIGEKEFNDIMLSPGDIKDIETSNVIDLGNFTIPTFKESDLIRKTEKAKKEYIATLRNQNNIRESFQFDYVDILTEARVKEAIKKKIEKRKHKKELTVEIKRYLSLVDWKYLYERFIKLFPISNPEVRFDLFELIFFKLIIPFKRAAEKVTEEVAAELRNIRNHLGQVIIKSVDTEKSLIFTSDNNSEHKCYKYPTMVTVAESYDDVETLEKMMLPTTNNIKTNMLETFFS